MKKKVEVIFDEEKRRDYLTGFHKRKVKAKETAHKKKLQQIKNEKKEIKQHYREITRQKILNSNLPDYLKDDLGVVNVEKQTFDESEVIVESIDIQKIHYSDPAIQTMHMVPEPQIPLKKALKLSDSKDKWYKKMKHRKIQSRIDSNKKKGRRKTKCPGYCKNKKNLR